MRFGHLISLLSIGFLLLVVALPATPTRLATAQSAPAAAATRVGIVNPARVFNEMAETKALRDKLEARRKELFAQEEQMRNEINTLIGQRQSICGKYSFLFSSLSSRRSVAHPDTSMVRIPSHARRKPNPCPLHSRRV